MVSKVSGLLVAISFALVCTNVQAEVDAPLSGASIASGAGDYHQPLSSSVVTREAKRLSNKPILPAPKVNFPGKWYMSLSKKADTCPGSTVPNSLNVGLNIDKGLNGTDLFDGSPFFKGKVSGNAITFGRARTRFGHEERQFMQLVVKGNTANVAVKSEIAGPVIKYCYTLFKGVGARRK